MLKVESLLSTVEDVLPLLREAAGDGDYRVGHAVHRLEDALSKLGPDRQEES